jgi:hypothetical protein
MAKPGVLVSCYNYAGYLTDFIGSVLNQSVRHCAVLDRWRFVGKIPWQQTLWRLYIGDFA